MMEEIQSLWKVPSIAHFCSLFRDAFNLIDFDIEELEEALLIDGTDFNTILIQQIVINLLKGCYQKHNIDEDNYDEYLMDLIKLRYSMEDKKMDLSENTKFKKLPIRTKVEILHSLCDYRLDVYDVADLLKNLDSDSLRVEPLGKDDSGATYWYFYGTRLYKEEPKNKVILLKKKQREKERKLAKKEKKNVDIVNPRRDNHRRIKKVKKFTYSSDSEISDVDGDEENCGPVTGWSVACSTEEDWQQLANKYKKSRSRNEKDLYRSLTEDFLPEIGRIAVEKEKNFKQRLLELAPRRASKRIETKKEQDVASAEGSSPCPKVRRSLGPEETESIYTKKSREERIQDRLKAKEARALRAQQRNEKLSSTEEDLSKNGYLLTEEEMIAGMQKVLDALKDHPNSWPFMRPVKEEQAPGYHKIIKKPIDLSIIEAKLENGDYGTRHAFEADVMLMLNNCREFNGLKSRYTRMAESLRKVFYDTAEEIFVQENAVEDPPIVFPPSNLNRPSRPKAVASLKRTLESVRKNSAALDGRRRLATPVESPTGSPTPIIKSWAACHTVSKPKSSPKEKKSTVPSIEDFSYSSLTPKPGNVSPKKPETCVTFSSEASKGDEKTVPLMPEIPGTAPKRLMLVTAKAPSTAFHRLPVAIGTSVRSRLAQAKPVQLELNGRAGNISWPNGATAVLLKPGAYVINNSMPGRGPTMVVVHSSAKSKVVAPQEAAGAAVEVKRQVDSTSNGCRIGGDAAAGKTLAVPRLIIATRAPGNVRNEAISANVLPKSTSLLTPKILQAYSITSKQFSGSTVPQSSEAVSKSNAT